MDVNTLRIAVTVASFIVFIGIVLFAVHPRNRQRFEAAERLPFDDEDADAGPSSQPSPQRGEGANVGQDFAVVGAP